MLCLLTLADVEAVSRWLTDEEQRILRQLAVFSGGFTRQAAAHVAGAKLSQLSALVGKSLLRRDGFSFIGDFAGGWGNAEIGVARVAVR